MPKSGHQFHDIKLVGPDATLLSAMISSGDQYESGKCSGMNDYLHGCSNIITLPEGLNDIMSEKHPAGVQVYRS